MSTFKGQCHCQHHQWEVTLTPDQSSHILCHCDVCNRMSFVRKCTVTDRITFIQTCKILGGGAYTMSTSLKTTTPITAGANPDALAQTKSSLRATSRSPRAVSQPAIPTRATAGSQSTATTARSARRTSTVSRLNSSML